MKSIVLNDVQARVLAETGELVVFDVMEPQPPSMKAVVAKSGSTFHFLEYRQRPGTWRVVGPAWTVRALLGVDDPVWVCPFSEGVSLWVAQEWQCGIEWDDTCDDEVDPLCGGNDVWFPVDGKPVEGYGRTRSAEGMPSWASRTSVTTASVEPVRMWDVSEEDMVAVAGKHPHYSQGSVGSKFGMRHCVFPEHWDAAHATPEEKWDADPWCWKRVLKKVEERDE